MRSEIGVVFGEPNDRLWIPRLRKWIDDSQSFLGKLDIQATVTPLGSCQEAARWRSDGPSERVLVAVGIPSSEINVSPSMDEAVEPVIIGVGSERSSTADCPSSSVLTNHDAVLCADILAQVRKSLVRNSLARRGIKIRRPNSDADLSGYLSLRYKVFDDIGYLRPENRGSKVPWEIDFWDRVAIPLCAVMDDGKVVGCTRLIRNFGDEEREYVTRFQRLLESAGDPCLSSLFKYPNAPTPPFDVLFQFPGFGRQFRESIQKNTKMAEVGRVIVDDDHRGQCLSEVLVDTAASLAKQQNVSLLFLACRDELSALYARCGFAPVDGLRSDRFFNIEVPSIVMQRKM